MREKQLKSMDKTQLLIIMRQQELEIQLLTDEKDELAVKCQIELERLAAEKAELEKNQISGGYNPNPNENSELVAKYQEEIEKIIDEKNELSKNFFQQGLEVKKLAFEMEELERNHQTEIRRLTNENEIRIANIENARKQEKSEIPKSVGSDVRFMNIEKSGSLAEAAVTVSGILNSAQDAADIYLNNIKAIENTKLMAAKKIEEDAQLKASAIIKAAEMRRDELEREEKKSVEELQTVSNHYMELISKAYTSMQEMTQQYKIKLPQITETTDTIETTEITETTGANEETVINQPEQTGENPSLKTRNSDIYELIGKYASATASNS